MQRPSDEILIAYLDGELGDAERAEVAQRLKHDSSLRNCAAALAEGGWIVRTAFDEVLHEPVPERLIAAARGWTTGPWRFVPPPLRMRLLPLGSSTRSFERRHAWAGAAIAASLLALMLGGALGYEAGGWRGAGVGGTVTADAAPGHWLDNVVSYHKLFVDAGQNDTALVDVPAGGGGPARQVAATVGEDTHGPDLDRWGLSFAGTRYVMIEGRPATQFLYTSDRTPGPVTLAVGPTSRPDIGPSFERRGEMNLVFWRQHGHAYALVGSGDAGRLRDIARGISR